jgi:PD-(D/E)XK nuclease superfamily
MTYSYTQIAQYLRCPRSYRHRYLDGWKEKDSRATLLFGRCFEQALGAYFRREDSGAALFTEWAKYQEEQLEYSHGDSWERMFTSTCRRFPNPISRWWDGAKPRNL